MKSFEMSDDRWETTRRATLRILGYQFLRMEPSGEVYEHDCGAQILASHINEHDKWHREHDQ